jgi:LysM repeat protein
LLLHIVAVAGIIAFNAIKTRQGSIAPSVAPVNARASSTTKPASQNPAPIAAQKESASHDDNKSSRLAAKSVAKDKTPPSSGKTYVVAKGDSPVTIAKKFKVSYDDLLALNHIDDPRKLKIGQKLLIPNKTSKAKKADE